MADVLVGLGDVTRARPVPADGRALVRYLGGRDQAVKTLTGMTHRPARGEYRPGASGDERYRRALTSWQTARTRVRRWDEGARTPKLTATDKRRAQRADRERRQREIRQVRVRIHGDISFESGGAFVDSRIRFVPVLHSPGLLVDAQQVFTARARGGDDAAIQSILDQVRTPSVSELPETTSFADVTIAVWADSGREPRWSK